MKLGYSILLGEIIAAEHLDYDDCRALLIVCPECREPIFKGLRTAEESETHYLSHYDKKIAYNADCENRVGGISINAIEKHNHDARNQRLTLFMSVLKNLLGKSPETYPKGIDTVQRKLERSASFQKFRGFFYKGMMAGSVDQLVEYMKIDYRDHIDRSGWAITTTFPIHVQERIAGDMFKTLCRPIARKNLDTLFAHAFLRVLQGFSQPGVHYESGENYVVDRIVFHMTQLITQKKKRHADRVIGEMAAEEVLHGYNRLTDSGEEDNEPSTYYSRIAGTIQTAMYEELVKLPYYEVLHSEYSDPSKELPYMRGAEPVTDEERARVGLKLH